MRITDIENLTLSTKTHKFMYVYISGTSFDVPGSYWEIIHIIITIRL